MRSNPTNSLNKRYRILVTQKFSSLGGAQKSLVHHFELLEQEKFEAHLLTSNTGWLTDQCDSLGVPWQLMDFGHWNIGSIPKNWFLARRICNYIRKHQIDLVHANEHWVGPHSCWGARMAEVPSICQFRTGLEDLTRRRIRKYWYDRFEKVLPVADVLRQALIKHLPDPDKVIVVRDGVKKCTDDSPSWTKRSTRIIVNIGAIYPVKGQAKILEQAIPWLKSNRKRFLVFIGGTREDPAYFESMRSLTSLNKLGKQVLFLGPRTDVPRLLRAADALVAYSTVEGIPRVVTEAMFSRRPVIVSNSPGMNEVVKDGVNGRIVNFDDDSGGFCKALESLATDYSSWDQMGTEAQKDAVARYSIEAMSTAIQKVYSEVLFTDDQH